MAIDLRSEIYARIRIAIDADILTARQRGRALASDLGFSSSDQALVATGISEIARNILEYAKTGELAIGVVYQGTRRGLLVIAEDKGPGIPDVEAAMQDGFSTGGGLGLGLPGTKRLMDDFQIASTPGAGTVVRMIKWATARWNLPM